MRIEASDAGEKLLLPEPLLLDPPLLDPPLPEPPPFELLALDPAPPEVLPLAPLLLPLPLSGSETRGSELDGPPGPETAPPQAGIAAAPAPRTSNRRRPKTLHASDL